MASSVPPIANGHEPKVAARYTLPTVPSISSAHPENCVLDAFRSAVAELVASTWGLDVEKVFDGVDTGKRGIDLAVAIPRFKKGKPDEFGKQIVEAVSFGTCEISTLVG